MTNAFAYLKWVALVLLIVCACGLVKQNRINEELALLSLQNDTTETDSLPALMSPQELTATLRSRTKPTKKYGAKNMIPYADIFKKHAPEVGVEWELLAAICYAESKFNPNAQSHAGAKGLMQLMPKPAAKFGLEDPFDPEQNIAAGTKYVATLLELYKFIPTKKEKIKFVLASYNAGPAHIMDARRLAKKQEIDPNLWYENVEYCLYQLKDSAIASAPEILFGQFKPMQSLLYVHKVLQQYEVFIHLQEFATDSLGNTITTENGISDTIISDDISETAITDIPANDTEKKDSLVEDIFDIFWE